MLWLLEFTRDGRRYRAELRSEDGTASWFVKVDDEAARQAFAADVRDEDSEEFRLRVVRAVGGSRRASRDRRSSPRPGSPERRTGAQWHKPTEKGP